MLQVGIKGRDGYEGIHGRWKRDTGHFLLCSEDVGKRDFLADLPRAATNVAATHLAATDFTITLPRLL
jgi:hypothetical protein